MRKKQKEIKRRKEDERRGEGGKGRQRGVKMGGARREEREKGGGGATSFYSGPVVCSAQQHPKLPVVISTRLGRYHNALLEIHMVANLFSVSH